jgi:hypothetical protein
MATDEISIQWKPIATAPKGESILLYTSYGLVYCGKERFGSLGEPQQEIFAWRCDSSGRFATPIFWHPIPSVTSISKDRKEKINVRHFEIRRLS